MTWNKQGVPGPKGPNGATGSPGTPGQPGTDGPQGPGAISFAKTLPAESGEATLAASSNGMTVIGLCEPFWARVELVTSSGTDNLQASGFLANEKEPALQRIDRNNFGTAIQATSVGNPQDGDIDVIARNSAFPTFARFTLHADLPGEKQPCTFWGMITPAS